MLDRSALVGRQGKLSVWQLEHIEGIFHTPDGAERWTPSFGQVFVTAKVESGS